VAHAVDVADAAHVKKFASAVQGEWSGFEATFSRENGVTNSLDAMDLPEEFREWGAVPAGYEITHSTVVMGDKFKRKLYRTLPSVCVFGEHIDVEEETILYALDGSEPSSVLIPFSDGAYCAGPNEIDTNLPSFKKPPFLEFCLPRPVAHEQSSADSAPVSSPMERMLVRCALNFKQQRLGRDVQAFLERFESSYVGGMVDGGSGFRIGWAANKPLSPAIRAGTWRSVRDESITELEPFESEQFRKLWLPHGLSVQLTSGETEDGEEELGVEVAWMATNDVRTVMHRRYKLDGTFTRLSYDVQTRVAA